MTVLLYVLLTIGGVILYLILLALILGFTKVGKEADRQRAEAFEEYKQAKRR